MATTFKKVSNNGRGRLNAEHSAGATTLNLKTGQGAGFPSAGPFWVTLYGETVDSGSEIVLVSSRTGDALSVTRAQQGTTATSWAADSKVALLWTAEAIEDIHDAINALEAGTATLTSLDVSGNGSIGGDLSIGDDLTVGGDLAVTGSITGTFSISSAAITGGTINGTTIGGTTPAAGTFTALTASGAVTISSINGLDVNPGSDANADLVTVGVTGAPVFSWVESSDRFQFTKGIQVGTAGGSSFFGGDLSIGSGSTSDDITIASASPIIYFGASGTDGSWRLYFDGTNLKSQKRIAGVWTDTAITP